jgi:hypothetical protein
MALNVGFYSSVDNTYEYRINQGKLTVRKLIKQMVRLPVEFSTGVALASLNFPQKKATNN